MQMQFKELDFTGQNIYAGIDVHKKNWQVSVFSEELFHKTFNQPPTPEVLHNIFPTGPTTVSMKQDSAVFGYMTSCSHWG